MKYGDRIRGLLFKYRFKEAGKISIGRNVIIRGWKNITLGNNVTLYDGACINASHGYINIGDRSDIGQCSYLDGGGGLSIGKACAIGIGVRILTESNQYRFNPQVPIVDQPIIRKNVDIGDDVWIGTNAVIFLGVKIGSHAIVGAGAVVREDVPEWKIAVGLPAKVIKDRRHE